MKLTDEKIKEIAENLECGMKCYYHQKTGDLLMMPDFNAGHDTEFWEDQIEELEENWGDYAEIEQVPGYISFEIMADFTETIANEDLKRKLVNALERPKPFKNFKWHIDNSGKYREEWFKHKSLRYINWVKNQLET